MVGIDYRSGLTSTNSCSHSRVFSFRHETHSENALNIIDSRYAPFVCNLRSIAVTAIIRFVLLLLLVIFLRFGRPFYPCVYLTVIILCWISQFRFVFDLFSCQMYLVPILLIEIELRWFLICAYIASRYWRRIQVISHWNRVSTIDAVVIETSMLSRISCWDPNFCARKITSNPKICGKANKNWIEQKTKV